jgi:23S rRNA (uridine2552-2'-O)-methyltransferase
MYRRGLKEEHYTLKAKQDRYPARSVYKLQQIDEKFNLFRKNFKILDLGCAPGSWLLYVAKKGDVLGIDLRDVDIELPQNAKFIKADIMKHVPTSVGIPALIGKKFDIILSDMAPNTSGEHDVDVENSIELCEKALEIAKTNLKRGGNFLCKIFEGEGMQEFFKKIEQSFSFAKRYKPLASRKESREIYIIGKNFHG